MSVDSEHVRRWERGPTEAALRHAKRVFEDIPGHPEISLVDLKLIGEALYEADRPVPRAKTSAPDNRRAEGRQIADDLTDDAEAVTGSGKAGIQPAAAQPEEER